MKREAQQNRPSVFEYTNYRVFLKDLYAHFKKERAQFSFRYLAKLAGFSSPNFFKLVMDGKRNLTTLSVSKFVQALKLSPSEAVFFRTLVHLNQAKTSQDRARHAEELMRYSGLRKIRPIQAAQYNYYSHWFLIPIREMAALAGFKEDPQWIAKQMTPAITPSEAKQALEDLEKLGLLIRDGQGKLRQADSTIMTSDEVTSASIAQFHREMMRLGARSIDTVPSLEREISAVTISVSPAQAKEVKKLIQEFRKKVLEVVAENSPETDRVYELNFQLFPLTKRVNKEVA